MTDQIKYTNKLANARILIIGGSSGIGYGVAEACVENNAIVAISSSNPTRVQNAIFKLQKAYPSKASNVFGLTVDLGDPATLESQLAKLFKETSDKISKDGKIDHVVFTAGDSLSMMKIEELSVEKIVKAGQIRFFAPLLAAKFVQQYLPKSPKSSYTITTGSIADRPRPNWSVIGSYAGGHYSMVRNLALDLKPVRVNGVSPGAVDTELWTMSEEEKKGFFKTLEAQVPTGKVGTVENVAETYLAVLKDANMDAEIVRTDAGNLAA